MSDYNICKQKLIPNDCLKTNLFGKGKAAKLALLAAFFVTLSTLNAEAALFGSNKTVKNSNTNLDKETIQVRIDDYKQQNINGSNLDAYQFAQTHFGQSKSKLEQICRAISSRYNDASARDILQKIFVIDTQVYMQNIKNSALSVSEVLKANTAIGQGLQDLKQIILSPGQQTLETLDKTIDKVRSINANQLLTSQKYLSCLESMIEMSQASYETFEIIPSLNMAEVDMFVQASKQLMTNVRSHSESFKGLLLNVKSSSEQIDSGLSGIKQTLKETLRFSDHFAIKQFPLINLPQPSREKIFVQVNSLNNTIRGIDNTVSIGDSQVRNTAQQFSHLVSSYIAKSTEYMKYQKPDYSEKAQTQISTYARNQVCGLFVRIKDDMNSMRTAMAEAGKANGNLQPVVNMESRSEYIARKAKSVAEDKLPLFLLGGKSKGNSAPSMLTAKTSQPLMKPSAPTNNDFGIPDGFMAMNTSEAPKTSKTKSSSNTYQKSSSINNDDFMFSEKDFASINKSDSGFMTSEMNILQQELGSDFFFGDENSIIANNNMVIETDEDLPNFGGLDDNFASIGSDDSAGMQLSYGNLEKEDSQVELLRYDSSLGNEDDESLSMMKYDSDILNFDELNEE